MWRVWLGRGFGLGSGDTGVTAGVAPGWSDWDVSFTYKPMGTANMDVSPHRHHPTAAAPGDRTGLWLNPLLHISAARNTRFKNALKLC